MFQGLFINIPNTSSLPPVLRGPDDWGHSIGPPSCRFGGALLKLNDTFYVKQHVIKICTQKSCENGKEVEASELNEAKQRVSTESTLFCSDEKGELVLSFSLNSKPHFDSVSKKKTGTFHLFVTQLLLIKLILGFLVAKIQLSFTNWSPLELVHLLKWGLVRSILRIVGIRLSSSSSASPSSPPSEEYIEDPSETFELHLSSSGSYIEEIRSRIPAVRFDSVCNLKTEHDCSVCLSEFQPESEINHLTCGHVFHQDCLEKWLNYWNITCPLCRTPLMAVEETSCFW
ncbi:hypothetical protein ACLB2K_054758 [Fragaria x ananassa]